MGQVNLIAKRLWVRCAWAAGEGIGQMDGDHGSKALRGASRRLVVEGDRFDDGHGQPPKPQKMSADFGMGGAEVLLFKLGDASSLHAGFAQQFGVSVWHTGCQNQMA